MIPVRLTLLLIGAVIMALLVLGNPQPVEVSFLFWSESWELYKIILTSIFGGIILCLIYMGHVKYLRRIRFRDPK